MIWSKTKYKNFIEKIYSCVIFFDINYFVLICYKIKYNVFEHVESTFIFIKFVFETYNVVICKMFLFL